MFDVIQTVYITRKECKEKYNSTESEIYELKFMSKHADIYH